MWAGLPPTPAVVCSEAVCSGRPSHSHLTTPTVSINLLLCFPHRGMTIWHPVYYTHSGFYLWSFPLLSVAPRGSRFQFFCSLLYSVSGQVLVHGWCSIHIFEWMNEIPFSIFKRKWSGEKLDFGGRGKWKAANPDGLHTQSLETRQRGFRERKRTFSRQKKGNHSLQLCLSLHRQVGKGFLESSFSALRVELMPKVQLFLGWWGVSPLPGTGHVTVNSPPRTPEVGREVLSAILTPAGSKRVPGCLLRSRPLQLHVGTWKASVSDLIWKILSCFPAQAPHPRLFPFSFTPDCTHCSCASLGETISTVTLSPTGNKQHQTISHIRCPLLLRS